VRSPRRFRCRSRANHKRGSSSSAMPAQFGHTNRANATGVIDCSGTDVAEHVSSNLIVTAQDGQVGRTFAGFPIRRLRRRPPATATSCSQTQKLSSQRAAFLDCARQRYGVPSWRVGDRVRASLASVPIDRRGTRGALEPARPARLSTNRGAHDSYHRWRLYEPHVVPMTPVA
jgi:hypothetical protein